MKKIYCVLAIAAVISLSLQYHGVAQDFWQDASVRNNVVTNVNVLTVGASNDLFAGTNGSGFFRSTDGGTGWTRVDPSTIKKYFYSAGVSGTSLLAGSYYGRLYRSDDNGNTWNLDSIPVASVITSIAFRNGTEILAASAQDGIFSSSDGGTTWRSLNIYPSIEAPIVRIDTDPAGDLFVSTYGSGIYRIAANDTLAVSQGFLGRRVNKVIFPTPTTAFAATERGLYYSDSVRIDSTTRANSYLPVKVWRPLPDTVRTADDSLLQASYITSVVGTAAGYIVAGTVKNGLFYSTDNGKSWSKQASGLRKISDVKTMVMNSQGYVYFGSDSGKVFRSVSPLPLGGVIPPSSQVALPAPFRLEPSYPNPFNPTTTIPFSLAAPAYVTVKIYNSIGQQIAVLLDGPVEAGYHGVRWDASNYPDGVYFYRLQSSSFVQSGKLVLLK